MIRLTKGTEPQVLANNKAAWTIEILNLIAAHQPVPRRLTNRYNHPDVKTALRAECRSKCMYCESKIDAISDPHIEHIRPKAIGKYPQLTFEYTNLGLACTLCNRNKDDDYDEAMTFINPYVDNPVDHFHACGVFLWANSGNERAKLTEVTLKLNRPGLIEQRGERLKQIRALIDEYNTQANQTLKNALREQILEEIADDKIYSFCCKIYFSNAT